MARIECFTSPRRLRQVITLVSFSAIFLWILCGRYVDERSVGVLQHHTAQGTSRKLLATDTEVFEENDSFCDSVVLILDNKGVDTVADLEHAECSDVHKLVTNSSACDFVQCADNCQNDEGLIPYLKFLYCQVPSKLVPLAMIFLFVWLIFLFITLGATAEEYFCPALTVMSQVLRLSQNVAGVTLLAFGNGAPDIFSAYAAISQPDDKRSSLAIGALFGAGIFVTTIVVGAVTISKPFNLTQRPFLRDIIFYVFAVFWTFYLLWTNTVTIYSAVGFVAFYLLYVIVVILGRVIYQKWKKIRKSRRLGTGDIPRPPSPPEGREMLDSEKVSPLGTPIPVIENGQDRDFSPLPGLGVQMTSDEEEDETKRKKESKIPKIFRIPSLSTSVGSSADRSNRPIIQVSADEEEEEDRTDERSSLLHPNSVSNERRQNELAGSSLPPLLGPEQPRGLFPPDTRRRGGSAGPPSITQYGGAGTPSPVQKKKLRKTISGALDVTEEVGAALGIPHVAQIWDEVHRSHSVGRSRSRSRSRSAIIEVEEQSEDEDESRPEEEEEGGSSSDEETPLVRIKPKKRTHPFILLLQALWPFGASFRELGILGKIYEVIKSPASFFLALTVPVVDRNEDNHNWNKWLNVLHCVTGPVFIAGVTNLRTYLIGGVFPVWTLILCLATFVAIAVACTSRPEKPPVYHCAFAWLGFAVAVVWIFSVANEIVNLLQAFGIVIKLSDGILGLTLLAWGNSIGDAVSNVTMAKQGFPRMAIGACFGGPLLNMLLGIGIASTVKTITRGRENGKFEFPLDFHQVEFLASIFLMFSLCSSLVVISCLGFKLKRLYGGFLIAIYIVFLTVACIAEFDLFTISIPDVITHE